MGMVLMGLSLDLMILEDFPYLNHVMILLSRWAALNTLFLGLHFHMRLVEWIWVRKNHGSPAHLLGFWSVRKERLQKKKAWPYKGTAQLLEWGVVLCG